MGFGRSASATSTTRYGGQHKRERRHLEPVVAAGGVRCVRCGEPIVPGTPWDLDHLDSGAGYRGPAHASCNRRAGGQRRWALAAARQLQRRSSRRW